MTVYYLGVDYDGWHWYYSDINELNHQMIDYPFVTTVKDVAVRMVDIMRKRKIEPSYIPPKCKCDGLTLMIQGKPICSKCGREQVN